MSFEFQIDKANLIEKDVALFKSQGQHDLQFLIVDKEV
jgi:hypothetical protein